MSARRVFAFVVAVTALATLAVGAEQARPRDPEWTAPADVSAQTNPLANRPQLVAGGRKLFSQRCSECHGQDGRGSDRAPDLLSTDVQMQPDGALFWKISSGNTRAGMPAFSFLPEPQRWQLVLYLRERSAATH
jgi:mono/diheme cytochrome c family protein